MTKDRFRLLDAIAAVDGAALRLRQSVVDRRAVIEQAIDADWQDAALSEPLDAFVQRYQQLVEHMTHRLYPAIYRLAQGERAPFLGTLLTDFEGRGLLASADAWKVRMELRNRLVHEYPLDSNDRAAALRHALIQSVDMLDDLRTALDVVTERRWLEDSQ